MKRLAIFCYYDANGIVDSYIEYLLNSLVEVVNDLIIVVNGKLSIEGEIIFKKFTNYLIKRKNVGFDGGSYSDVIVNYLGKEMIKKWDEIVLCNDTFFGPFTPFKDIFYKMSYTENDFWGLNFVKNNILDHIQSYFLVFKEQIVQSGRLFKFFKTWINPQTNNIEDIYAMFEIGIFEYMISNGYKFDVFSNTENYCIYESSDICIESYGLPILKKKVYSPQYYNPEQQNYILWYLTNKSQYNINHIYSNIKRQYKVDIYSDEFTNITYHNLQKVEKRYPVSKITRKDIKLFVQNNKEIYIYGTGIIAKKIWRVYYKYINKFNGFIISDEQDITNRYLYGFTIKYYNSIPNGAAIIIAMNAQNTECVKKNLKPEDIVLLLW